MSSDPASAVDASIVVTVHLETLVETVVTAVERAGRGAEVTVVWCPTTEGAVTLHLETRERGARGVPVLGLVARRDGIPALTPGSVALLGDPRLRDLNVAVPTFDDDPMRRALWDRIREERMEERHQLVEVDGRSALPPAPDLPSLAAAAAGVLAGRMAAADRVWSRLKP